MELTRRSFLKLSGASTAGFVILKGGNWKRDASSAPIELHKKVIGESTTICCYCGVGCGAIAAVEDGKLVNMEGDPDHPINQGTLCPKGQAIAQIHQVDGEINPRRITKPMHRAPGASSWQEITWEDAINKIAAKIKDTRDKYFITQDANGKTVNRCEAIAQLGGGELDIEECYLASKMARALGIVYVEHCARL
jgi:formate dehydrogenase major subunit